MKIWDNYKKPTPDFWRKVGDAILMAQASLSGMIMTLPISEHYKLWATFIINAVGIIGKIITNFAAPKQKGVGNGAS